MDQVFTAVGDAINGVVSNPYVQLVARGILVYFVFLWVACAYWAYRDLQSRTNNPIAPYLAAIAIILFTPILFPFGLVLYLIVRPREKIAEANERAIAEEAMLREIEMTPRCAACGRRVESDWLVCPTCRNQLRRVCPSCSHRVELDWIVCAWCGQDLRGSLSRPAALVSPASPPPLTATAASTAPAATVTATAAAPSSRSASASPPAGARRSPARAPSRSTTAGPTDL